MLIVGLTGNIASGKTTVANMLAARGATLIDADVLARRVVELGTPAYRAIVERWGTEVTSPDGALDRAALRERVFGNAGELEALNAIVHPEVARLREAVQIGTPAYRAIVSRWGRAVLEPDRLLDRSALRERVFGDPNELEALNAIVHPEVARLRDQLLAAARARGDRLVIADIPLLFERHLAGEFDRIVLVDAPRTTRLERLVRDRRLREDEAMNMITAQMPAELKRARADCVIDNVGSLAELAAKVDDVWRRLEAAVDKPRARKRRSSVMLRSVIDSAARFDAGQRA